MRKFLLTALIALFTVAGAWAQTDTIVTMKTAMPKGSYVYLEAAWTGDGSVTVNGVAVYNASYSYYSVPATDSVLLLIATGNVALTTLYCGNNQLVELNIAKGADLEALYCQYNL